MTRFSVHYVSDKNEREVFKVKAENPQRAIAALKKFTSNRQFILLKIKASKI